MSGPDKLTDEERAKSIAAFEKLGLCTQLAEAAAILGWKQPSHIQEQAVPHLLQGKRGSAPAAGEAATHRPRMRGVVRPETRSSQWTCPRFA